MRHTGPPALARLALLAALCAPAAAADDRIVVRGDTLRGEVTQLKAEGVVIELDYGSGAITVPWRDVEDVETEGPRTVLYGDRGEVKGRILGLDAEGRLLVGEERESARAVEPGEIFASHGPDDSFVQRLRSRFRYWRASLDVGASYTEATTDRTGSHAALRIERRRDPVRWLLEAGARYAAERESGEDRNVTENSFFGFTRGEYDLSDRTFAFASTRATHDAVQELSLRLEPRVGLGLRLIERRRFQLSSDIGGAWIYEDFFGGRNSNDYWSVAFGAQAEAKLPYGAVWRARAEYLPAVDDWIRDYLIRGHTELDFPVLGWLSFVVSAENEYDNTPAEGTQRNRLTSALALRARFP